MNEERIALSACVTSATMQVPLIVRGCVRAAHSSLPRGERELALSAAIRNTKLLLEELKLHQTRLGWRDHSEGSDPA